MLPANFFDEGTSICPSVLLLNKECPGCGITRAIQHLIHFDFLSAWQFNMLSFIVLPIIGFFWIKWTYAEWKKLKSTFEEK